MLSDGQGQTSNNVLLVDRQQFFRPWLRVARCGSSAIDAMFGGASPTGGR
jgi:hypothetical protein